jgi:uncharacterized protein (DUF2147 family)
MKSRISWVAAAVIVFGAASGQAFAQGSPVGVWETIDDDTNKPTSHVEIWEKDGKYFAKIVKLLIDPPDTLCTKCEGERKNEKVLGMTIMWNMKKDDDEYSGGRILDPKNGKTYRCKIWREGNTLKVRGYVFIFYRTQKWTLISEGKPAAQ